MKKSYVAGAGALAFAAPPAGALAGAGALAAPPAGALGEELTLTFLSSEPVFNFGSKRR